ncbi:hypothetical protein HBI52_013160 [Parastagonospora nodorum]|nr:hypothetical protein HBI52_013160 [Parastagonospora nodorum]
MGIPTTAQGPAPAYEAIFGDHPVNRNGPSGSTSASHKMKTSSYTRMTMTTFAVLFSHEQNAPESTIDGVAELSRSKPHAHCELCDIQTAARQRQSREHEKFCCTMVAMTFSIAFVCAAIFGIVAVSMLSRNQRRD